MSEAKMYSLVNSNFNRTYNPSGRHNALSDIKRLLTSRDTAAQKKACGYLIEVASRYNGNSEEGGRVIECLLANDITVFLCEATSNLDFSLFKSVATCMRLLWVSSRFFSEEHAAHASSAVLRALAHYTGSGPPAAVDTCLHFLCDLLNRISASKSTPPLSHQSAYSAVQLLACLNSLAPQISINSTMTLSSALVLEALVSYQPDGLYINSSTAKALVPVLSSWVSLTLSALQHAALVDGVKDARGMGTMGALYVIICTLCLHAMGLIKLFHRGNKQANFVQAILADDEEVNVLKQSSAELARTVHRVMSELVVFTKEYQSEITSEEYGVFLKFLLTFFYESRKEAMPEFCDMLFDRGYLTMLPKVQILRNDASIRKASTLVLGELLKVLADKYLNVANTGTDGTCANDIHMGLVELQNGIERPQSLGMQLQKGQPYSLLIYIYFYCQSSDNPEEATAPLLKYLVEHILKLPKSFKPPPYIIKSLWLVFAMSTISSDFLESIEERVHLEKATARLVSMLQPDPSLYYTHNPAILLWAFTSQRISSFVKFHVMYQWFKLETSLPPELTADPTVWELLLNVLVQSDDRIVVEHCMESLQVCVEDSKDDIKEEFTTLVWVMLPNVLSKALIDEGSLAPNICYLLDLATTLLPSDLDPTLCLKIAVLIMALFSKNITEADDKNPNKFHFEYVCLKLCLYLLGLANNNQNDNRVLISFVNRAGFLPSVLSSSNSPDERVACAALQLLSYVVHYFTKNNYQPKSVLQIQTQLIIQSFRRDSNSDRRNSLLQLVYLILNSGANTPLALTYDVGDTPVVNKQCTALRCLMFRIQLMLCSRESNQLSAGWKTLSSIFKHAIVTKNDTKLVATLTSQPWTFTLVQFQISEPLNEDFLIFLHNWLTLLKITVKKNQEESRRPLSKYSLVTRTMMMLKKNLKESNNQKDMVQTCIVVVNEILMDSAVTGKFKY